MTNYSFRPATRTNVSLLIGLAGGTGSGKTFSSFRLASGLSAGKRFAVIDTENGRASYYADDFQFDVLEIHAPFSPDAYTRAIQAADAAGYGVIVVDSMSHVWAGDGGVLDMQEAELDRMAGDDWKKREAVKMAAWIRPKKAHKDMVQALLQVKAHVILCFRAEPKIEMVREDGKTKIVPKASLTGLDGWLPVCDKNLPFELTCSFLMMADHPGVPKPIKLPAAFQPFFPNGELVDEKSGVRLGEWATGATGGPTAEEQELTLGIVSARDVAALKAALAMGKAHAELINDVDLYGRFKAAATKRHAELTKEAA